MKDTKFRVFVKDENKMVYANGDRFISLDGSYYKIIYNMARSKKMILSKEDDDNVLIMQYTGLKDKTGKDSYTKDVILVNGEKCIIEKNFGMFGYYDSKQLWKPLYKNEFEIIGNELIKP